MFAIALQEYIKINGSMTSQILLAMISFVQIHTSIKCFKKKVLIQQTLGIHEYWSVDNTQIHFLIEIIVWKYIFAMIIDKIEKNNTSASITDKLVNFRAF